MKEVKRKKARKHKNETGKISFLPFHMINYGGMEYKIPENLQALGLYSCGHMT